MYAQRQFGILVAVAVVVGIAIAFIVVDGLPRWLLVAVVTNANNGTIVFVQLLTAFII